MDILCSDIINYISCFLAKDKLIFLNKKFNRQISNLNKSLCWFNIYIKFSKHISIENICLPYNNLIDWKYEYNRIYYQSKNLHKFFFCLDKNHLVGNYIYDYSKYVKLIDSKKKWYVGIWRNFCEEDVSGIILPKEFNNSNLYIKYDNDKHRHHKYKNMLCDDKFNKCQQCIIYRIKQS